MNKFILLICTSKKVSPRDFLKITRRLVRRMVMQMETKSYHGVFVAVTVIPRFVCLASVTLTEGGARDVRAGRWQRNPKSLGEERYQR